MAVKEQILKLQFDTASAQKSAEAFNAVLDRQEKVIKKGSSALGEFAEKSRAVDNAFKAANAPLVTFQGTLDKLAAKQAATSNQLKSHFDQIRFNLEHTGKAFPEFGKQSEAAGITAVDAFKRIAIAAGGVVVLKQGFDALKGALEFGPVVDQVSGAFDTLQSKAGLVANDSLQKLRTATQGLVSDFDLMQKANSAALLGLDQSKYDQLAGSAVKLGQAIGKNAVDSIESLNVALGRGSTEMLDNLGIVLKVEQAQQIYAASLGKTTKQLTEAEKAEAFRAVATQKIIEKSRDIAAVTDSAGIAYLRFNVQLENFQTFASQAISSSNLLGSAINELTNFVNNASLAFEDLFDTSKRAQVQRIAEIQAELGSLQPSIGNPKSAFGAGALQGALENLPGVFGEAAKAARLFGDSSSEKVQKLEQELIKLSQQLGVNVPKAAKAGLGGGSGGGGISDEAKKAAEEVAKLRAEFENLGAKSEIEGLKGQIEAAIQGVDENAFDSVLDKMEDAFRKLRTAELTEQFGNAVDQAKIAEQINAEWTLVAENFEVKMSDAIFDVGEKTRQELDKGAEESAEELERQQIEAFGNSVDFFSEIITGVIDGDLKETLERMLIQAAIKFGAEMLAQLTASFALQNVIPSGAGIFGGLLGGGAPGVPVPIGGTPVAGAGAAAAGFSVAGLLPLAGAIAGALVAQQQFSGAQNFGSGKGLSFAEQVALALPTFGGSFLANPVSNALGFGGGLSGQQAHLGGIVDQLIEAGVLGPKGTFSLFGGGEGRLQASQGGDLSKDSEQFAGLGNLFSILTQGDVDEQFAGLFAKAISDAGSFNEALLTTSGLLDKAGISGEQAGQAITQAYLDGTISIEEYNSALDLATQLGKDHLDSLEESADLLAAAIDGPPRDALKALEIEFGTLKENGITQASAVVDYFTNTFGPEAGQSIQDMISGGIDLFGDFANLTVPQIQLVLNEIQQMQGAFADVGEAGQNAGNRARKGIDLIEQKIRDARRQAQGLRSDLNNIENSGGGDQPGARP